MDSKKMGRPVVSVSTPGSRASSPTPSKRFEEALREPGLPGQIEMPLVQQVDRQLTAAEGGQQFLA